MRDAYPLACRAPALDPFFENVLAIEGLSAEQVAQINDLRARFDESMAALQVQFVAKIRQSEPERETERVRLAADQARNVQATKGEQEPYKDLITERDRLTDDTRTRVLALLTDEQKAKVPGIDKYREKEEERVKPGSDSAKKREALRSDDGVLRGTGGDGLGTQSPTPRGKGTGDGADAPR
jgi:hypothetical protein